MDSIIIHLWPNAYKNNQTELAIQKFENGNTDFKYAEEKDLGFIDSLNFKVNGEKSKWNFFNNKIDISVIYLNKSLIPGDSITITTPFS